MTPRIEEIEERMAKATPGPWAQLEDGVEPEDGLLVIDPKNIGVSNALCATWSDNRAREEARSNARLIAHAPADLRFLLEENKRLREIVEMSRRVIGKARLIGTEHSGYCATVLCNCSGHAKRRVELADEIGLFDGVS